MTDTTTITLSEPWTYRTPLATIEYPAGEHTVTAEIAAAAPQPTLPAEKDETDGHRTAKARSPRRSDPLEG